jgi:hypothetical protein
MQSVSYIKKQGGIMKLKLLSLVVGSMFANISHASLWNFQEIYVPGSLQTNATDINNSGVITGYYQNPNEFRNIGFLIENGIMTEIPITDPWGLNDLGAVVGGSYELVENGAVTHGQLFSNGVLTQIDVPGYRNTWLTGINNSGVIIGIATNINNANSTLSSFRFTYENGIFSEVVIPGYDNLVMMKIGNDGTIYGGTQATNGFMLRHDGTLNLSNYTAPYNTYFTEGNASGQVVGWGGNGGITDLSFVYENGNYIPIDDPHSFQTQAYGINDAGNVVGWGWNGGNGHGFLATRGNGIADSNSVPEPESITLIGLGLSAMAWTARRRKYLAEKVNLI